MSTARGLEQICTANARRAVADMKELSVCHLHSGKDHEEMGSVEARKILIRDEAKLVTSRVAESTAVDCWEITDCVIKGLEGKINKY